MGRVEITSSSQGQILENSVLHSRVNISDRIVIKLGQNVCFDNI